MATKVDEIATLLLTARRLAEVARDDLQAAFDEKSERWQEGEKGQVFSERIDAWGALVDSIENAEAEAEAMAEGAGAAEGDTP